MKLQFIGECLTILPDAQTSLPFKALSLSVPLLLQPLKEEALFAALDFFNFSVSFTLFKPDAQFGSMYCFVFNLHPI